MWEKKEMFKRIFSSGLKHGTVWKNDNIKNHTLLHPLKKLWSEIGSFKKDLRRFDFSPFGGSLVIFTPMKWKRKKWIPIKTDKTTFFHPTKLFSIYLSVHFRWKTTEIIQWNPEMNTSTKLSLQVIKYTLDGMYQFSLTISQTTNFRLLQTERLCRWQFQIRWKW